MRKTVALLLALAFLTALCIVSVMPPFHAAIPPVKAQTEVTTSTFISVEPNPAELNQPVQVTIRVEPAPPTPTDIFRNLTITYTRSDGGTTTLGSHDTNPDGSQEFLVGAVTGSAGVKTLKVSFPGQFFDNGAVYYLPSENQTTLTVNPPPPSPWSTAGNWTRKAPMHQARSVLGVAAVNGKIYAIGGSTQSGFTPSVPPSAVYGNININEFVGTNEEYDPTTDTWVYKASMPTPRMAFATAVYQNKVYCIGGRTSSGYTGVNEVYDPATDTWETKASMPTAGGWLMANVVYSKIYVMDYSGTNYMYDPAANSWTTKAPVPVAAFDGYASAVLDEKMYVVGGLSKNLDGNLNLIYDSVADTWSYGENPPSSHGGGAAGATTGEFAPKRIYVLGERANLRQGEEQTFVRVYDPETDSWTFGADAPTSRYNFGVAVVNDTLYAIGGHTYSFSGDFAPVAVNEQYTPVGYGTPDPGYDGVAPEIAVLSPENKTYSVTDVPLDFTVSEAVSWLRYSLDGGNATEVSGNTTLTGLALGAHNLTVYATDASGNTGTSETIYFTIAEPEPFPTTLVVAPIASVAVIGAVLAIYFKKRKH